ncbi:RHS repeat-associated core domain-containing protein [Akkermansia glycaniphila]|uniref:RHS repeat-associated core domain-containing protein n=1 Tax=Akkermansia glycaniphila TaxID=1679444 RepID=UPI0031B875AC
MGPSEPVATRPLALTLWTREGTARETLYYTHDLQKNVTALFGQAAGRRAQYEYDPYGNPINTTGDAAGINPYRYSSEYHDEDLGLIYYNYRHYNPTDGRWTSRDPIAEKGSVNLYGFVGNNSLYHYDLLGNDNQRYQIIPDEICYPQTFITLSNGKDGNMRRVLIIGIAMHSTKKYKTISLLDFPI